MTIAHQPNFIIGCLSLKDNTLCVLSIILLFKSERHNVQWPNDELTLRSTQEYIWF